MSKATAARPKKVTTHTLRRMKEEGRRIVMITAYDATFARLLDAAGADVLLVGDSLGMVVQGHDNTLPVTADEMVYHCRAVARGVARAGGRAHVVCDMPFMSYQLGPDEALRIAGRMVQEGGAEAVKLEGGAKYAETVRRIAEASIPVMGHIGLTPQSVHQMGGFKVQGRTPEAARALLADAEALQDAGAYAIVLEGMPRELAAEISGRLQVPTIGIGAGAGCDGQVLVCYDLLGMDDDFVPRFVRRYADLATEVPAAARRFAEDVRAGRFPAEAESFSAPELAAALHSERVESGWLHLVESGS